mgnify:CR=1 FL=1
MRCCSFTCRICWPEASLSCISMPGSEAVSMSAPVAFTSSYSPFSSGGTTCFVCLGGCGVMAGGATSGVPCMSGATSAGGASAGAASCLGSGDSMAAGVTSAGGVEVRGMKKMAAGIAASNTSRPIATRCERKEKSERRARPFAGLSLGLTDNSPARMSGSKSRASGFAAAFSLARCASAMKSWRSVSIDRFCGCGSPKASASASREREKAASRSKLAVV